MNIIEAEHITKDFTRHRALDDVSIEVPEGKIYGLLGPNGAGKTTLIRIINHITLPDAGTIRFGGHDLTQDDVRQIGYLPEERGLYRKMKVGEQALFFAQLKGMTKADATAELKRWFERLDIADWWGKKVQDLSKGMAQKVQFIITVLHRPRLLIFDEPFSGFDPVNVAILKNEILRLRDEGATIIFSTHNMGSVEELCDRITLINRSRNILTGDVDELRSRYGNGRYQLTFNGDEQALAAALMPMAANITQLDDDRFGCHRIEVQLGNDDDRREAIATANGAVELMAFNPLRLSMNDIFIKAVADTHSNDQNA